MVFRTLSTFALITGTCIFLTLTCREYIAAHEIVSTPNGFREMKGQVFSINNCGQHARLFTGSQFAGNYTLIGQQSDLTNDDCLVKTVDGRRVMDSMQAIVLHANGWAFEADSVDLDDIDAQSGVGNNGWKEAMEMLALLDGQVVRLTMATHDDTVLSRADFAIPGAAMKEMGLDLGETAVPDGEYADSAASFNSPFGWSHNSSQCCRLTGSPGSDLDTLMIVYALKQKSKNHKSSAAFFSEVITRCKHRYRTVDVGSRMITAPVAGVPGERVQRESTAMKMECDVLGNNWCSKETMVQYMINGTELDNGNLACERLSGYEVRVESAFTASSNFIVPV